MSKKRKSAPSKDTFKKIITNYINNPTIEYNQEYQIPEYIFKMCQELHKHLSCTFDQLLMLEMKASVEQDYITSLSTFCKEI